jgi:hypothetical protein
MNWIAEHKFSKAKEISKLHCQEEKSWPLVSEMMRM